ncbi:MAG TPA: G1 family glutamic endopeptidase [Actinospica sp.]|jgi:hypothetical protein|nr:G1 family glutamic endopeptidase [Actinospica sp.]
MSFQRSPLRIGIAACALTLPALAPAAAATAAASPVAFAPIQHTAGAAPFFISHGGGRNTTTTSTNWSGYAATGANGAFTSVTTTFTQPAVTCTSGNQYSSFWVGLDGYSSNSVEQTGTEADCSGSSASYSAWYEMYPKFPVTYSNPVKPGDVITESVTFSGTKSYTLTLTDTTEGWTKTTTASSSKGARSSAEVIAEAPYSGGVLPLADFGKVSFSNSTVNGATLSSFNPVAIDMVSSSGAAEATTGSLSGGNFSITWNSY